MSEPLKHWSKNFELKKKESKVVDELMELAKYIHKKEMLLRKLKAKSQSLNQKICDLLRKRFTADEIRHAIFYTELPEYLWHLPDLREGDLRYYVKGKN